MSQIHGIVGLSCLAAASAVALAAEADSCSSAPTTVERTACRGTQIEAEENRLARYFGASTKRSMESGLTGDQLQAEQSHWLRYRESHCGNVYVLWSQGTIRYEMSALCKLKLTRDRTYDLWRAYLTYMDSTPPVLPDPRQ